MQNIYRPIFPIPVLHKLVIVLTTIVLGITVSPTLRAQPANFNVSFPSQQITNGLFAPTNSQRFFEEGRRQFETEIQNLRENQDSAPEELLKIDPEVLWQESISPLENPQLVLDSVEQLE